MGKYIYDGQEYESKADAPDLGSFGERIGNGYWGYSEDVSKLPKYDNMPKNVFAFLKDTKEVLFYDERTKTWQ